MKKRKIIQNFIYTALSLFLTFCMLTNARLSLSYASLGLKLWFDKMVPALFPFMILSGIMIRLNLTENFTAIVYPFVGRIFQVSPNVCYCMIIGFLCGFPMGAKTVSEMYERGKISNAEADFLLSFVNNIGPVYFTGYVLPLLSRKLVLPYVAGMYGIPLLYGLFLRYFRYGKTIVCPTLGLRRNTQAAGRIHLFKNDIRAASSDENHLFHVTDSAIQAAVSGILSLGGYMVFFNMLNLVPHTLLKTAPLYLSPLFEISGGLSLIGDKAPIYTLLILQFGGFCCIAQTYTSIRGSGLRISAYLFHKIVLTLLTGFYYLFWYLCFPESFLL